MHASAAPPRSVDLAASGGVNGETPRSAASARAGDGNVSGRHDWQTFCAAYFPNRRRHDLEALVAYGAHRRHTKVTEHRKTALPEAECGPIGRSGLQVWEDEGGATA
jgi:hypothetical protein